MRILGNLKKKIDGPRFFPLPISSPASIAIERKGYLAALLVGFVYGVALGPCTFAYMAAVLAVGFRVGASSPLRH